MGDVTFLLAALLGIASSLFSRWIIIAGVDLDFVNESFLCRYCQVCRLIYNPFHPLNTRILNFWAVGWMFRCPSLLELLLCSESCKLLPCSTLIPAPPIFNISMTIRHIGCTGAIISVPSSNKMFSYKPNMMTGLPACRQLTHFKPSPTFWILRQFIVLK